SAYHGVPTLSFEKTRTVRNWGVGGCPRTSDTGCELAVRCRTAAPATSVMNVMLSDYRRWLEYESVALGGLNSPFFIRSPPRRARGTCPARRARALFWQS